MLLYHVINREVELCATTNLRTAKDAAKAKGAYAVVVMSHLYSSQGPVTSLVEAYIWGKNIGCFIRYSKDELVKLSGQHIDLLPSGFLDCFS